MSNRDMDSSATSSATSSDASSSAVPTHPSPSPCYPACPPLLERSGYQLLNYNFGDAEELHRIETLSVRLPAPENERSLLEEFGIDHFAILGDIESRLRKAGLRNVSFPGETLAQEDDLVLADTDFGGTDASSPIYQTALWATESSGSRPCVTFDVVCTPVDLNLDSDLDVSGSCAGKTRPQEQVKPQERLAYSYSALLTVFSIVLLPPLEWAVIDPIYPMSRCRHHDASPRDMDILFALLWSKQVAGFAQGYGDSLEGAQQAAQAALNERVRADLQGLTEQLLRDIKRVREQAG